MDHNDRQAIEGLFRKLGQAERQQPHRDPEAEAVIAGAIARQPGAAYYLAQTVIMQEQALNAAQRRIEELERMPAHGAAQPQGGIFGRMFGAGAAQPRPAQPRMQAPGLQAQPGPWSSGGRPAGGGGFLAGAAQTAMGVAGGVLLGNAIGGMFAGPAEAGETDAGNGGMEEDPGAEDPGFDEGGWEE